MIPKMYPCPKCGSLRTSVVRLPTKYDPTGECDAENMITYHPTCLDCDYKLNDGILCWTDAVLLWNAKYIHNMEESL